MKKLLVGLLALALVLGLCACGSKSASNPNLLKADDCEALYLGAQLHQDYDGDDAIALKFAVANNGEEAASFAWTFVYDILQDGAELDFSTIFVSEDSYDTLSDSYLEDIAPGETQEVILTHKLNDLTTPVEMHFTNLAGKSIGKLTIDPAQLARAEQAASSGSNAAQPSGSKAPANTGDDAPLGEIEFDEYAVTYLGGEITVDADGNDTVVLNFDYVNKDTNDGSFGWSVYYTVLQGGAELESNNIYINDNFDCLSDNIWVEIAPGETAPATITYVLENRTDPVIVEFTDLFDSKVETLEIDLAALPVAQQPEPKPETEETGFSAEFAQIYSGDWHGVAEFYDCTGDFSDNNGGQCDILARLVFDEAGVCIPYVRLALSSPEADNFSEMIVGYDEEYECMTFSGMLSGREFGGEESFIEVSDNGALYIAVATIDDPDHVFKLVGCLRRLDEAWDYDVDYPYLVQDAVNFYKGKDFFDRVKLFDCDPALVPEMGGTPGGNDANAAANTSAAAEGIVELQTLIDFKQWLNEVNCYETQFYKPTFEECIEQMGCPGSKLAESEWTDTQQKYKWQTEDGKDNICMVIRLDDEGVWRWHSISWTSGVNG